MLIKPAIMADRVLMVSTITRVTALKDLLEITVRLIRKYLKCLVADLVAVTVVVIFCGWGSVKLLN